MATLREFSKRVTEYDTDRFIDAVDDALDEWLKNDIYRERVEHSDAPGDVETLDEVVELPVVDMREFKRHPRDLLVDPERVDERHALYSSGTTADTKSFALRSAERVERQKRVFKAFSKELWPAFDYAAILSPDPDTLDDLPPETGRRALFRYVQWGFEPYEHDFFLDVSDDLDPVPETEALLEAVGRRDGNVALFGPPTLLAVLAESVRVMDRDVDLGDRGAVITGGGWKGVEERTSEFREKLTEAFGIRPEQHLDIYSATELSFGAGNAYGQDDPDLKRLPPQGFFYVADEDRFVSEGVLDPVENGEPGLMVAVDPINTDYPGVILTDDVVRKTGGRYGEDVRMEYVRRFTD